MARYNNVTAIVLGLEINGLSVVRALGRARVVILGIDQDVEQITALSKFLLSRIKTPDIRGEALIDTLLDLTSDGRPYALFPTMDGTVLALSEGRDRLPAHVKYRLPDRETVRTLIHKSSFRDLCKTVGMQSPGHGVVKDRSELEAALETLRLPVILKTDFKRMGAGPKAVLVHDMNEAQAAYQAVGEGEVVLEEWIPGTDREVYFCLQAYSADSELLASMPGRKIRQWPPLVGGTASAEPVDLPELEEATTRFFKALKFQGLCSMEYKFDKRDGIYYAIEPTVGRTDFQSGLAPANGVNLPLSMFLEMAGMPQKPMRRRFKVKWVNTVSDTRAAWHYMDKGELTQGEWKKSLSGPRVTTLFSMDDPGPWVSDLFRRLVGRLKRIFQREGQSHE